MGSKHPNSLHVAIAKAAENIEFEFMMVSAAEDARRLAARYPECRETEILSDIVAAVLARRERPEASVPTSDSDSVSSAS
jgi:hypothetical protein